jgi:hypothetical protein
MHAGTIRRKISLDGHNGRGSVGFFDWIVSSALMTTEVGPFAVY